MHRKDRTTLLEISLGIERDLFIMPKDSVDQHFNKREPRPIMSLNEENKIIGAVWHEHIRWLRVNISYNYPVDIDAGHKWETGILT